MFKSFSLIILVAAVSVAALAVYYSSSAPAPDRSGSPDAFSTERAFQHLRQIAKAPHSLGTEEDNRVRAYIDSTCKAMGLHTEIQHTTGLNTYGHYAIAGNIYNVIVRLKGQHNTKAVMIAAHYDSQPNAAGAGDDGAGCAAILEVARLLIAGPPLQNDVIFLFTDGEENGLLGASGFAKDDSLLHEVGVILNFEGRGNAGISHMFETNPENGWIMREYAKAAKYRFASSLNYEVYKNLPNSTDYSIFKQAGVSGLNHAFIDGYVNYHSMTDRPENLDPGSLQDHGGNMLSLARHFGNIDLTATRAPDVTYFDILGGWLILYPASFNLVMLIIGNLLIAGLLLIGFIRKMISVRGFLAGSTMFLVTLIAIYFLGVYFSRAVRSAYPLYNHFYSSNSYNVHFYFLAATALAVTFFSLVYRWLALKFSIDSLFTGIGLIGVIVMDILYTIAPTAIYFVSFPLIFILALYLFRFSAGTRGAGKSSAAALANLVFLLPALLLLPPVINGNFIAFGMVDVSAISLVMLGFLMGLLLPLLAPVFRARRRLVPSVAFAVFLAAMAIAHFRSGFNSGRPLQTNIRYLLNADEGKGYWVSQFEKTDDWNKQFFAKGRVGNSIGDFDRGLINEAPAMNLPPSQMILLRDTVVNGIKWYYFHCQPVRKGVNSIRIVISKFNPALEIFVNGKHFGRMIRGDGYDYFEFFGIPAEGIDLSLGFTPNLQPDFYLFDRSMGLPSIPGFPDTYPSGIIPGTNEFSNTTQVVKHFKF